MKAPWYWQKDRPVGKRENRELRNKYSHRWSIDI
jgi:hypothetical protein